jgi:hypothetical protein
MHVFTSQFLRFLLNAFFCLYLFGLLHVASHNHFLLINEFMVGNSLPYFPKNCNIELNTNIFTDQPHRGIHFYVFVRRNYCHTNSN